MKLQALLVLVSMLAASGILLTSIASLAASPVSGADGTSFSTRTLYIDDDILPDHSLYPALMVVDRVQLVLADPQEKILIQVQYADRRLNSGLELLKKDNKGLAVTTITKAEKYLQQAALAAKDSSTDKRTIQIIQEAIHFHAQSLKTVSPQLNDSDRSVIDSLVLQNEAVLSSM